MSHKRFSVTYLKFCNKKKKRKEKHVAFKFHAKSTIWSLQCDCSSSSVTCTELIITSDFGAICFLQNLNYALISSLWNGPLVFFFGVFSYKCPGYYSGVIMGTMASQITSLTIVYSTVYSRRLSKTSKRHDTGFCANSPHEWPVTRKMFLLDDVIMIMPTVSKLSFASYFVITLRRLKVI